MEPPVLLGTVRRAVAARTPLDERERASIARTLRELDRLPRPFAEDGGPVHVTGSAVVVGPRGLLLHRHKRLGLWLQPGGHLEPGETPWDAARREVREETGLDTTPMVTSPAGDGHGLVHVDVHPGPRGHTHLDLRYLLAGPDADPEPPPGESPDVRWFGWDEAVAVADAGLVAVVRALRPVPPAATYHPPVGNTTGTSGSAAARWADALAAWAIPHEILDAAPARQPWRFSPEVFAWTPERAAAEGAVVTPSRRRALDALGDGGTVLDVGAGGGRASLPLSPPASLVTAVDSSAELLDAFSEAAIREGVAHRTVLGAWPDVAPEVEPADVVVCHNVAYNVADLPPFVRALTDHARRRVVLEITAHHPASNLNHAWQALHGLERPTTPTWEDAVAVLQEMGLDIRREESERQVHAAGRDRAEVVASARQRLCVGPDRDAEVERLIGPDIDRPLRRIVTVWWDGTAGG